MMGGPSDAKFSSPELSPAGSLRSHAGGVPAIHTLGSTHPPTLLLPSTISSMETISRGPTLPSPHPASSAPPRILCLFLNGHTVPTLSEVVAGHHQLYEEMSRSYRQSDDRPGLYMTGIRSNTRWGYNHNGTGRVPRAQAKCAIFCFFSGSLIPAPWTSSIINTVSKPLSAVPR